jgi:ubiquitin-protein ligase E3 A
MDQVAAKEKLTKAFLQYTRGCPRSFCLNPQCARSPAERQTNPNAAAVMLLELLTSHPDGFLFCPEPTHSTSEAYSNFFDLMTLGSSFVSEDSSKHRIDFGKVAEAYEVLARMMQDGGISSDWMSISLAKFEVTSYSKLHLPRVVLMLLTSPSLFDPEHYAGLQALTHLVSEVPESDLEVSSISDDLSTDILRQIVQVLQQYLTIRFCEISRPSDLIPIARAIKLLDCFHSSNTRNPRISAIEFYNDAANKEQNMKTHFRIWFDNKMQRTPAFTLVNYPWILDASSKTRLLSYESFIQMRNEMVESFRMGIDLVMPYFVLEVRRENLLEDTLQALVSGDNNLKMQLRVQFIGEDGVDEGGVKKEFFQLIVKELFDPIYSMFNSFAESRLYWFNPRTLETNINFELIGIIFGLAIYNGVILDVHFPAAVYKKLLKMPTSIDDLEQLNPELVRGFRHLLAFEGNVEETFCWNFTAETLAFDEVEKHELKLGGHVLPVTNDNREEFVSLYVQWFLNSSISHLFDSFYRGFWRVCGGEILQMFTSEELELMICGNPVLNFYELQRTTVYESGYSEGTAVVVWLWELVHGFTLEQKKKFLSFVTGSDRAPIEGLGSLHLKIARNGPDSDRLMTASTCFNYLLLPEYDSKEKLLKMLHLAINNAEGFGLR